MFISIRYTDSTGNNVAGLCPDGSETYFDPNGQTRFVKQLRAFVRKGGFIQDYIPPIGETELDKEKVRAKKLLDDTAYLVIRKLEEPAYQIPQEIVDSRTAAWDILES